MIAISKLTQDTNGALIINELNNSSLYDGTARVSRTATLDGGVVIDHSGFVAGDRTLNVNCVLSATEDEILTGLFESETFIYVSTKHGFYKAAIERLSGDGGNRQLTILLKEAA